MAYYDDGMDDAAGGPTVGVTAMMIAFIVVLATYSAVETVVVSAIDLVRRPWRTN